MNPTRSTFDRPFGLRLLAVATIAGAGAAIIGVVVGLATYAIFMSGASESDGWAELGAAIFGAVVGLGGAAIAYVVAVVLGVRRIRPPGGRARPTIAAVLSPAALTLPGAIAPSVSAGGRAPDLLAAVAALLLLAAIVVGLAVLADVAAVRPVVPVAGSLAAAAIVLFVVTAIVGAAAERGDTRAAIERIGTLPLIDGERLDEPFPGWTLDAVRHSEYDDSIDVHWDVEDGRDGLGGDAHMKITATDVDVRVHAGDDWLDLERQLRSRLVGVPADRFIEACGRRC